MNRIALIVLGAAAVSAVGGAFALRSTNQTDDRSARAVPSEPPAAPAQDTLYILPPAGPDSIAAAPEPKFDAAPPVHRDMPDVLLPTEPPQQPGKR